MTWLKNFQVQNKICRFIFLGYIRVDGKEDSNITTSIDFYCNYTVISMILTKEFMK